MIQIQVILDGTGLLRRCEIRGHAGAGPKGGDIVCAAVSVLARAALGALSGREGIVVRGGPGGSRGEFSLETEARTGAARDFLAAAGAFLVEGLRSVAGEYPKNCTMTIQNERRN
ncbi:MAG: ribosomal-processing cysteine protease Prp [Spirochaetaceae bacterium]|jgi:uncharacterized protein YsxB (DUF464 family)|nr:ribosomal-processing cysteine protease Prp [Spirochaetaceae bacterium]